MNVTVYHSGAIVITADSKEYDVLLHAILLLELSSIGTETNVEKLRLIESIKKQMQNISKG